MNDENFLWVQDELAWNCRECFVQFSVFQRKHHCRRCGGLFCSDHAPSVELSMCFPAELLNGLSHDDFVSTMGTYDKEKQVRLCKTCRFEIFHAEGIFQEVWDNKEKLSFSYWQGVVFDGKASLVFNDCTFPINLEELEQWVGISDSSQSQLQVYHFFSFLYTTHT